VGENIRILLVDDHTGAREGLASLLRHEDNLDIIGEASDGRMAVELAKELQPDVIIMDAAMPGMNGIEATRLIMLNFPEIKVIGFTMHSQEEVGAAMQKAGAIACISKSQPAEILISKIRDCHPA
jgi:DNA-binding NarL/FixJ family response regulator